VTCRIGFIGAGGVAARHAQVLSGFSEVSIVGVADPDAGRAAELARPYDAAVYDSHNALLDNGELDAVYVCVPPFAHGAIELAVLDAGLPLFVEKPLALDEEIASKIAVAAAERGVVTAVGHHWRYLDLVEQARRLLEGRPVRLAVGFWLDKVPPVPWWVRRDGSGGQVIEQAVHVLDLARVLVGEVVEVSAQESGYPPDQAEGAIGAATGALLRFRDGAAGILGATCLLSWKHRAGLEVYAEGLALHLSEEQLIVDTGSGPQVIQSSGDAKERVDRAFIDAVLGRGDDVRATYPEAMRTHRLACAVARAATTGRPVQLEVES
jgi:myo-inositol 2-dehydrogenase / D-chiro-inositol 1-dehydrogenase